VDKAAVISCCPGSVDVIRVKLPLLYVKSIANSNATMCHYCYDCGVSPALLLLPLLLLRHKMLSVLYNHLL
jgi:hypothetical protein